MDIELFNSQVSQLSERVGSEVQARISATDLNNPASMLKAQFSMQQYSTLVNYQSAVMKAVKDMLAGIIQKI
ncbi:type III secretion apparatus needle protein [Mycoavidus cysteinexigens]|uniref:Type III secretion apparatus needle protein n=1 Tax=Mycoavidus cysteinexigens TaxID=1553431 RepID=A0A2Z6ETP0_9BURK|nr:type III secretion system needle filament subunit SctF [Mycoavidus cysteinexigens]BBE08748.1 type III secretion apparatus needle protein [Mycoavidus cysteinexigens]GAM52538.1 type III secretion protein SsaG [bacterium endosymbiont of Mortierella elongata FMR23-6]GLR01570.1 type III secretion system needle protein SsaG [Mycoavidus cysteinexigens]